MQFEFFRVVAVALAVGLAGCAGTAFKWSQLAEVRVGMSMSEVQRIMGPPNLIRATAEGERWTWSHANGLTGRARAASIILRQGIVVDVPPVPSVTE